MCSYTTHIRVCARCAREDTVLISEQLCPTARTSGIFGSCLEGVLCQRDATGHRCWQCKEIAAVAVAVAAGAVSAGPAVTGRIGSKVVVGAAAEGAAPTRPDPVGFSRKWD
ncbi:hypothetical protein VTH06DRAFT_5473 [Thermothelomyces fergusii]